MPQAETHPRIDFRWTAHPAADRPRRDLVLAVLTVSAMAAACGFFGGHWAWGVLALFVHVLALNRFFLPSRFSIDAEGITAKYPLRTQRLHWRDIRRFVQDPRGGYLSTRAVASRMDAFSGMHLIFSRDRDRAVAAIRSHLEPVKAASAVESIAARTAEVAA